VTRNRIGRAIAIFALGCALGAISWAICPLVSARQEPFDSAIGFLLGQSLMVVVVATLGWRTGFVAVLVATVGCYVGQLAYTWMLGGEHRTWFPLGVATIISLCVLPFLAGGSTSLLSYLIRRHRPTRR